MKAKADWTYSYEWAILAQLTQGGGSDILILHCTS